MAVTALALGVLMLLSAEAAAGAERWAAPSGTGPDCTQAAPCSLDTAVEDPSVLDGDEVILTPGTYTITESDGLNVEEDINLHGQSLQPRPTLSASVPFTAVRVEAAATVRNLKVDTTNQVAIFASGGATIEQMEAHSGGDGGTACNVSGDGVLLRDSVCWATGTNTRGAGTNDASSGTMTVRLRNVTAVGGTYGIDFNQGFGTRLVDAKNVIADGGTSADVRAGASSGGTTMITLTNSNYATELESGSSGDTRSVTDPGTGTNQTQPPVFVDAGAGNFHQQSTSPTIDAGELDSFAGNFDYEGDARSLEGDGTCPTAPDIGADEFIGSGPIDCDPPETTVLGVPTGATADSTPSFTLESDEAGSTFECRIDGGAFALCPSPYTTPVLADGNHTLEVRAIDPSANVDPTPASRTFRVDTDPPDTTISGGPTTTTSDRTPTFALSADESGSSFECKVDEGPFGTCASPYTTPSLGDGSHTIRVRAIDAVGNPDSSPASRSVTIDATAPDTTITAAPKRVVKTKRRKAKVSLSFQANEAGRFECKLDDEGFSPCSSPLVRKVARGRHTWMVRATDRVGNVDGSPAKTTFKVKRKKKRR